MNKDTQTTNIVLLPGETAFFLTAMYKHAHIHHTYILYIYRKCMDIFILFTHLCQQGSGLNFSA